MALVAAPGSLPGSPIGPPPRGTDHALDEVEDWWRDQTAAPERIGDVLRRSFDEVLDGQRTGRFLYEDLANSEKTYVGTKVEILLRDEFDLPRGPAPKRLDFGVRGYGVDCKYTQATSWMIPVEAVDELCILITASDATSQFSFGLLRCYLSLLNAPNRDQKRSISSAGRSQIRWLWRHEAMPPNLLRNLPEADVAAIFARPGKGNGQARINELLRRVHAQIIRREVILTVAQQDDSMKRPRDARRHLQPEGIVVLGHQQDHPRIARDLGLPIPKKGEFVARRVVAATPQRLAAHRRSVVIAGQTWVEALPGDPNEPGPADY